MYLQSLFIAKRNWFNLELGATVTFGGFKGARRECSAESEQEALMLGGLLATPARGFYIRLHRIDSRVSRGWQNASYK